MKDDISEATSIGIQGYKLKSFPEIIASTHRFNTFNSISLIFFANYDLQIFHSQSDNM